MRQTRSALCTASLQYFSAVGGLHSFTEAVYFASLALLRLIRSKHFSVLLTVFGVFVRIAHIIIMVDRGICQGVWGNFSRRLVIFSGIFCGF